MLKPAVFLIFLLSACDAGLVEISLKTLSVVQNVHQETSNVTQCPSKHLTLIKLENGKTYYFGEDTYANWTTAKESCVKAKMHLASPKTQEELNLLSQKAKQLGHYSWLVSASDIGQEAGDFRWHDGTPLSKNSTLWFEDEPSNFGKGEETCVFATAWADSGKLLDNYCSHMKYFVCEVPDSCP